MLIIKYYVDDLTERQRLETEDRRDKTRHIIPRRRGEGRSQARGKRVDSDGKEGTIEQEGRRKEWVKTRGVV